MNKIYSILALASLLTINQISFASEPIKTTTALRDERELKNFTGVGAGGPIDVVVKLGDNESIRFEGDKEAIATLVTEVKGSILIIRPQTSWTSWAKKYENKKITAYVTAKQLSSIAMSGNGSINVIGAVTAAEFAVTLSGSGSVKLHVDADKITGVLSGSGNIEINGKAKNASVTLSGPGTFGGKSLVVDNLSARISGSGNINVKTDGSISAFVSGSGHVYYTGNPDIKKTVIGSGGVIEK